MSHAIDRARERYGLILGHGDMAKIRKAVSSGHRRAVLIDASPPMTRPHPGGLRDFAVRIEDAWYPVRVARNGFVVTFLDGAEHKAFRAFLDARYWRKPRSAGSLAG